MLMQRNLSLVHRAMSSMAERTVICEEVGKDKGIITLNRQKALNAINLDMVRQIYGALKSWQDNKSLVIIKGAGEKAFCAGGDVRALVENGLTQSSKNFFREEYRLNALIGSYKPDYVAIVDGITMGGGVGLSVHGKYRVATERTMFAMPETAIGLFPDVGGGFFLPRLEGKLGLYLGLTGFRLKGQDVTKAGIATHYVESKNLDALEKELCTTRNSADVNDVLNRFNVTDSSEFVLQKHIKQINKCFAGSTVEDILANLESDGSVWAQNTLKTLAKMSPTSLKVSMKQLDIGRTLDLRSCLKMEFRMAVHCVIDSDFKEGVRAMLIDRDQAPKWKPIKLNDVSEQQVERFFGPLPDGDELVFEDEVKSNL
ncbi:3-hydroxyisobutyryl-CoA hydrolase, mitochondrial [Toxorhynchites rutilus septentrionalis]|uniref:3-hydroxyisobutyryl-CoA hydrolase, mitochondrial n=1 Tax=Toxorhynchites rutilus septentrionalis TaxID=329112 RepID=UPI00247A06C3|nr:3-hydroxyisobutyryl-CoA hydrolase, mitochondrial [Toxorhynchites rutilus septentrionalis]